MAKILTMYCWASGKAVFTYGDIPEGALIVAKSKPGEPPLKWRKRMAIKCRMAHDNKTLLIPGIPEAETQAEAIIALGRFADWIRKCEERS